MTQPEPSQDLISGGAREPEPQFFLTPVSSDNYVESREFWHKNIASPTLACTILSALDQYFAALRIGFLSSAQQREITREGFGKASPRTCLTQPARFAASRALVTTCPHWQH
jgi:hypothetical protein